MPRRTVLSAAQRAVFETLPTDPAEFTKHYLLSDEDLELVQARRREENRLGFAMQLYLTRHPGRLLRVGEQPPQPLLRFIADQISADADTFAAYAARDETRREHALLLRDRFGLTTFKAVHLRALVRWLVPIALDNPKGSLLVGAALNELRQRCRVPRYLEPASHCDWDQQATATVGDLPRGQASSLKRSAGPGASARCVPGPAVSAFRARRAGRRGAQC